MAAGTLSLAAHFYLCLRPTKEWEQLHLVFFGVVSLLLFVVWTWSDAGIMWFVYPIGGMAFVLAAHYWYLRPNDPDRFFRLHVSFCVIANVILFIFNLMTGGFGWFIYPLCTSVFFLAAHYNHKCNPGDYFRLHIYGFVLLQIMLFLTWSMSGMGFPWFAIVLFAGTFLLFLHYHFRQRRSIQELPSHFNNIVQDVRSTVTTTIRGDAPPTGSPVPSGYAPAPYAPAPYGSASPYVVSESLYPSPSAVATTSMPTYQPTSDQPLL